MKTRHIVMTARPVTGRVAFVRAATMRCGASAHPLLATSYQKLDRDEGPLNPGEEGA